MKAVIPFLAPLAYFHLKSHQPSFQGSPREQRHLASLAGVGMKAKTFLHGFLWDLVCDIFTQPSILPPSRRKYFVFLFCTTLRACATPTSNNKQSSKSELGPCGCGLQHNVPKEGHLSAPACSFHVSAAFGPTPTFSSEASHLSSSKLEGQAPRVCYYLVMH